MKEYGRIFTCSDALLLFLQSLNPGSYFQLIGFGTDFEYFSKEPLEYTKENIQKYKEIIKNLKADKEDTNLYKPLISIFQNPIYDKFDINKEIIVLTDGAILDKEKTISLIASYSDKFTLHTIGIGSCDPDLVKRCAIVGNGYSYFTGTVSVHQSIIEALDNTQKMKKFECTYENNYKDKTYIEYNQKLFISPHDFIRYGFILDEKISDIEILIKAKDKENKLKFNKSNIKQLPDGDKLGKIIVDNYLKKNKEIDTSKIIKLSKAFSILTPETAFFAEIQNEEPINENMLTFSTKGKTVDYNEKEESIIEENKFESNDFGFDIKTDSPKKKKKNIFNKFLNLFSKKKKNEIIKKKEYIYDSPSKYKKENNYDSYLSKPEYKKPKYKKSKTNYKKSKKEDMEDLFIGYSCPRPDFEKEDEIKFIFEKREVKKEEKREAKKEEKKRSKK